MVQGAKAPPSSRRPTPLRTRCYPAGMGGIEGTLLELSLGKSVPLNVLSVWTLDTMGHFASCHDSKTAIGRCGTALEGPRDDSPKAAPRHGRHRIRACLCRDTVSLLCLPHLNVKPH